MKRALTSASAALLLLAGLVGCGDDDESDPAVETTPVVSTSPAGGSSADPAKLSAADTECKNEIVRQMEDPTQETDDTPPECQGIPDDRILELVTIAEDERAEE